MLRVSRSLPLYPASTRCKWRAILCEIRVPSDSRSTWCKWIQISSPKRPCTLQAYQPQALSEQKTCQVAVVRGINWRLTALLLCSSTTGPALSRSRKSRPLALHPRGPLRVGCPRHQQVCCAPSRSRSIRRSTRRWASTSSSTLATNYYEIKCKGPWQRWTKRRPSAS